MTVVNCLKRIEIMFKFETMKLKTEIDGFIPETGEIIPVVNIWKNATGNTALTYNHRNNQPRRQHYVTHGDEITITARESDRARIETKAGVIGWVHYGFIKDFKKEYIANTK